MMQLLMVEAEQQEAWAELRVAVMLVELAVRMVEPERKILPSWHLQPSVEKQLEVSAKILETQNKCTFETITTKKSPSLMP